MNSSTRTTKKAFGGSFAALAVLALAFSCTSARAQILFDNGAGDPGATAAGAEGLNADTTYSFGLYAAGDIFTPTASGTAQSISFAGFYLATNSDGTPVAQPADSFTIYLYSVTPGTDGAPDSPNAPIGQATLTDPLSLLIGTSDPTSISPNIPIYQFTGNLTVTSGSFALSTGSEYYLGISDTTSPASQFAVDSVDGFVGPATEDWQLVNPGSPAYTEDANPGQTATQTYPDGDSLAFTLSADVVPEPSTWALILCGLGLLVFWRTRKSRAQA